MPDPAAAYGLRLKRLTQTLYIKRGVLIGMCIWSFTQSECNMGRNREEEERKGVQGLCHGYLEMEVHVLVQEMIVYVMIMTCKCTCT